MLVSNENHCAGWNEKWGICFGKKCGSSSKGWTPRYYIWPRHSTSTQILFMAALFIIAKKWNQPQIPSTDEGINKIWHIHAKEYYLAIKSNEIPIYATTWVDPENIMLNERRESQKATCCMVAFIGNVQNGKSIQRESRWIVL